MTVPEDSKAYTREMMLRRAFLSTCLIWPLWKPLQSSLTVSPANSVAYRANPDAPRVVVNRDRVGEDLGLHEGRDVWCTEDCDVAFLELSKLLGWLPELRSVKEHLAPASQELLEQHQDELA